MRELTDEILGGLGTIAAEWWSQGPSLSLAEMEEIGHRILTGYREHELLLTAVADTATYDPVVRASYGKLMDGFIGEVTQMIVLGREAGLVPDGPPARETAGMITWMFERTCYQLVRGADPETVRRIAQANAAICWRAIFART
ncbi:MAG: hypothetical protein ACYDHH_13170 [Solirubrobacteraceae bacterium]